MITPALIILSGLPGTGKTTIARKLAATLPALHLRIDRIEAALRKNGHMPEDMCDYGYQIAHGLAEDNLRLGHHVIADCVNAYAITRCGWQAVAARAGARALRLEIQCSDKAEHRRRIEARLSDIPGARLPGWKDVQTRDYVPWEDADLHLNSAKLTPEESAARIAAQLN